MTVAAVAFGYGLGVGHYRWMPFDQLQWVRGTFEVWGEAERYAGPDDEIFDVAFTDKLSFPVLRPAASTIEDIWRFNDELHTPVEILWSAKERISIKGAQQVDVDDVAEVLRVDFTIDGVARKAYAYGSIHAQHSDAVLLIPGSGDNKARTITSGDPTAYHCCLYDELRGIDRFVQIKPNEGLRAVHDGEGRLQNNFIVNWHLNRGSSYSAAYLVEAVALHLYLRSHYDRTALAGLSQGGQAALITAMVGPAPDALVVASGYSTLHFSQETSTVQSSGHNQIIIPGIAPRLAPGQLVKDLNFPTL